MRSIQSVAFRIFGAAILGIITTVVIAWGGAALYTPGRGPATEGQSARGDVSILFKMREQLLVTQVSAGNYPTNSQQRFYSDRTGVMLPAWTSVAWAPTTGLDRSHDWICTASGWPMRSMLSWWREPAMRAFQRPSPGPSPGRTSFSTFVVGEKTVLPLGLIPLGFTVDSLIFASAWWLLLSVFPTTRRFLRHRRGACLRCGYGPLSGNGCPECGCNRDGARAA